MLSLARCNATMRQLAAQVIAPKYRAELIEDSEFPDLSLAEAVHVTANDIPCALKETWSHHFGSLNVVFEYGDIAIDFDYDSNGIAKTANVRIDESNYKVSLLDAIEKAPKLEKMSIETGRGGRSHFWVEV